MYLLGRFSDRSYFDITGHFKSEITAEDLAKCKKR